MDHDPIDLPAASSLRDDVAAAEAEIAAGLGMAHDDALRAVLSRLASHGDGDGEG